MSYKFRAGTIAVAVSLALGSSASFAAPAQVTEQEVERIAVVGSRAAPRSVAESPVPIDIVGADELGRTASSDMLDQLQSTVPSFNVRAQPISDAATLIRPVNLRGLSSDSTLILVNGKRRHRASVIVFQGGGVNDGSQGPDVSVIPSVALKQVEVLRDGAAAQYGSDAIAGVMNFVLKDDADGGSLSVKQGEYYEGDGTTTIIDGNLGMPFTDDGFVNLSFQLKNADPTSRSVQRPDAAALIEAGNTDVPDPAMIWGNPKIKDDITIFANVGLDLGDDKEFYMFGNYAERDVEGGFYYRNPHNRDNIFSIDEGKTLLVGDVGFANDGVATCQVSNVYRETIMGLNDSSSGVPSNVPNVLDTQAYQDMVADPNCFSMNQLMPGGYTPRFGGNIVDTSLVIGTSGEFSTGWLKGWYFDLSGAVGNNKSTFLLNNSLNASLGLDSPVDFDTGGYSQLEKMFNVDLVKEFDAGFEEPLNFAMGAEWREESFEITGGEEASWQAGAYAAQGFNIGAHGFKGFGPEAQGINTRRSVALYSDVEIQFTEALLVAAALRYEDFTSFGDTLNYKLTAQYAVNDELSLRASHSTGFRAPTVGQANVVNTSTSVSSDTGELIQSFIAPPTNPLAAFYGGKELTPEESVSYAAGIVFNNGDFFLTVDYFNIEVTDRIAQSSQITVEAEDYDALEAAGVQNPELISAVTYFANDFDTTTQGVDIVANYSMQLMDGDTDFSLAYNWTDTEVDSFNPDTIDAGKVERLEDGIPAHRATLTMAQKWQDISLFVRTNYFGEYYATHADDVTAEGSETADAAVTVDLEASYYYSDALTLSAGANNIFDQEAQKLQEGNNWSGAIYYESGPFDYNGGYYYVKASYNF